VVEDDRPALRRDATREALADRDPDPALDLLLEANGGPRDQLALLLVEEQDGRGVRAEHLADARQQLGEQLIELQVRERGVCDLLETLEMRRGRADRHDRSI